MKVKTMATSGIIAALYVAVTFLIAPFGFTNIQFRLSEMFNHLVVFNKKYIVGVVLGVFIANLLFSELGPIDLVFGVGQSVTRSVDYDSIREMDQRALPTDVFQYTCIYVHDVHYCMGIEHCTGVPFLTDMVLRRCRRICCHGSRNSSYGCIE